MTTERYLPVDTIDFPDPRDLQRTAFHKIAIEADGIESGQQLFSTSFTLGNGKRPNEILIVNTAFLDGPHTPMQTLRGELYAAETGLDVISVGIPAMASRDFYLRPDGDHLQEVERVQYTLTKKQSEALAKRGDFRLLGENTWHAVQKTAGRNGVILAGRKIHLLIILLVSRLLQECFRMQLSMRIIRVLS